MDTRKVTVPFRGQEIPVYLVYTREVAENGATLDVLLPLKKYLDKCIGPEYESMIDLESLTDRWSGAGAKQAVYDWRDVSKVGWGLRLKDPKERGHRKNEASLLLVFFGQCMMRGFLHRLVSTEMDVLEEAQTGRVYWKPKVEAMRREVEAYKNVMPDCGTAAFVLEEIKGMWRRVLGKLDPDNKQALQDALRQKTGQVLKLQEEATAR